MKIHTAYLTFNTQRPREYINIIARVAAEGTHLPRSNTREGARCEQRKDAGSEGDAAYAEIREEPERPRTTRCDADRPAPPKFDGRRRKRVIIKVMGE